MSTPSNHGYTLTIIAFHADDICVFSYSRLYATEQEIIRFRAGDYTDSNYRRKPSNLSKVGVDMSVQACLYEQAVEQYCSVFVTSSLLWARSEKREATK